MPRRGGRFAGVALTQSYRLPARLRVRNAELSAQAIAQGEQLSGWD